jgi:EmrB/QacA subfamily drug resistance transporter
MAKQSGKVAAAASETKKSSGKAAAERVASGGGSLSHKEIVLILIGLMAGMFLSALDQSVVGSAMRTIADDLKGLELQAWTTTAYLITSTVATPIYGKLGDIFGRRRMFLIAISIFIIGSVACGFAGDMLQLAGARAFQGIGAGGLFALAITVLSDIVSPRERARYQGYILAVFASSSVLGPVVGGLFAGTSEILWITGWRWVFLINIPVGAIALYLVWRFLHVPHTPVNHRIDWWGATTIVLAVVPLLLVAENGREWGWDSPLSIGMYLTGAIGIVWFILAERKAGDEAILPLKLFKSSTFTMVTIVGVIVGAGMFGGMMTMPLVLQIVNGANPTEAGLLMLPMVAGMMIASIVSGQVTSRTGKYKVFLVSGTAFLTAGYFGAFTYTYDQPLWQVSVVMVVIGMGIGQLMQTLTLVAQNAVSASDIGVATSSSTFFRQMGGTLGVAIFISILFNSLPSKIAEAFTANKAEFEAAVARVQGDLMSGKIGADDPNVKFLESMKDAGGTDALGEKLNTDSSFLTGLDPALAKPFLVGFSNSALQVFYAAAAVVAVAFLLSWFVKAIPLRTKSASEEKAEEQAALAAAGH